MVPLVEIPDIIQHYAPFFASVFSSQAFEQFQRYVSGLIVSENKTVDGINRLFVLDVRNQSSLNRLLTESPFLGFYHLSSFRCSDLGCWVYYENTLPRPPRSEH